MYILAANEAAGSRDFQFPALKMKALGIKERTARKYIKELVDAGFIELVRSGRNTRTPNDYRFSFHWLELPNQTDIDGNILYISVVSAQCAQFFN